MGKKKLGFDEALVFAFRELQSMTVLSAL